MMGGSVGQVLGWRLVRLDMPEAGVDGRSWFRWAMEWYCGGGTMEDLVHDLRGRGVVTSETTLCGILRMQCGAGLRLLGLGRNAQEIRRELYYVRGWQYQERAGGRWALQQFVRGERVGPRRLGRPEELADWLAVEVGGGMWGDGVLGGMKSRWEDHHRRVFRVWGLDSLEEARVAWGRLEEQVAAREARLREG